MSETKTLAEIALSIRPVADGDSWGKWIYRKGNETLEYQDGRYYLDLERMTSSAAVLDWVMQVVAKTWCSPQDIKNALAAIHILINPQAHLCSWGRERGRAKPKRKKARKPEPIGTAWELSASRTGKIWRQQDHDTVEGAIREAQSGDITLLGRDPATGGGCF